MKKIVSEIGLAAGYFFLMGIVMTASALCPEFDAYPFLEYALLSALSLLFLLLAAKTKLVVACSAGVLFYLFILFNAFADPLPPHRVSLSFFTGFCLVNIFLNSAGALLAAKAVWKN